MPLFETGDLFAAAEPGDFKVITTNSFICNDGRLAMGAGAAREAAHRHPFLARHLGDQVTATVGHLGMYGLLLATTAPVVAFQVKKHFEDPASLTLLSISMNRLVMLTAALPKRRFHLNYPGIGPGGLPMRQVAPLLERLPLNVTVWKLP
ncbi:MAG: hypothetical protein R3253_02665 [Longimicrobiales bacterium]|nr:hypothetical protein [Longimicrobiales bacterium]